MATQISGDTVITMTVKQLWTGIIASGVFVGGAIWVASSLTMGNLKQDVADIRSAVTSVEGRNADTQQDATKADAELRANLSDLTAQLKITNAGLTSLTTSMTALNDSVKTIDENVQMSIIRQTQFETWVVGKLGAQGATPISSPENWQKAEDEIVNVVRAGGDPLTSWFKYANR